MSDSSNDAWWTRSPSEPSTSLEIDDASEPSLEIIDGTAGPVHGARFETTVLSRRRLRQIGELRRSREAPARRRPVRPLLAVPAAVLALGCSGVGVALALRPDPAPSVPEMAAARAVPVDRAAVSATASSTQTPDGDITYSAANTLDGDATTAWNSNGKKDGDGRKDGKGPGIALTYTFTSPVTLRDVTILNGYQKVRPRPGRTALDLFPLNARVRRLRVVTDAGAWLWDVADSRTAQTFTRAVGRTGTVRLEIVSVYPSATYPDVALSEVSFTSSVPR